MSCQVTLASHTKCQVINIAQSFHILPQRQVSTHPPTAASNCLLP